MGGGADREKCAKNKWLVPTVYFALAKVNKSRARCTLQTYIGITALLRDVKNPLQPCHEQARSVAAVCLQERALLQTQQFHPQGAAAAPAHTPLFTQALFIVKLLFFRSVGGFFCFFNTPERQVPE